MRLKFMAILVLALMLFTGFAFADGKRMSIDGHSKLEAPPCYPSEQPIQTRAMFESFETTVPPAGWTHGIFNTGATWGISTARVLEGLQAAYLTWDTYNPSDETLSFDQYVDVAGGEFMLSFWMAGSLGYEWDLNVAETVEIDDVPVFDFDSSVTTGYMIYEKFFVDLSDYDGTTVTITFRYAGQDGDAHYLDAVMVDDGPGYVIPPPPDIDFCALVEDAEGTGMFYGDTCDGANLIYDLGTECNNYVDNGYEDYYGVWVEAGGSFTATITHESDTAAWILGECFGPEGVFTCLDHADDTYTGDPEVVTYTNTTGAAVLVYIVVDSYSTDSCGTYEMNFQGMDAIANEVMSLGDVKSLYR